jgi:hypothetical protein
MNKNIKLSKRQKEIIKNIGLGVLVISAIAMPGMAPVLKLFKPRSKFEKQSVKRSFEDLVNKNVIFLSGDKIKLSKKGTELYKKYSIEGIKIKKPIKWNGVWHLVSYDIPEKYKKNRDYFRLRLIDFGFTKLQNSLWVIPWECKEEIVITCQNIGVQPFVVYMNTKEIPNEERIKQRFGLDSINS